MFKKWAVLAFLPVVVFVSGVTYAAPVITHADSYTAAWVTALTDPHDLLQTHLASTTATGNFNVWTWCPLGAAVLKDGQFFVWPTQFATWTNNAAVEYYLNTSVNTYGYTITGINTYGGWNDGGRDAQQYSIYYRVVGSSSWILYDSVDYNPANPVSPSLSRLAWSTSLQNVDAIKFVAPASVENGSVGLCEIDVIGTPTPAPTTVVNAGAAQNVWLSGGIVDVSLNGTVTSSVPYTVLWSVVSQPAGSTVVFTPAAANAEDLSVRLDKTGTYVLKLTATDGGLNPSATVTVTVYADACAYAQVQPGFAWMAGDINYDCEVNLEDLTQIAKEWLNSSVLPNVLKSWQKSLDDAAFVKVGSAKLNATEYQYSHIGLAGTVLRVGPHGFTSPGAPNVFEPAALGYYPFLAQQYWWGDLRNTQRQEPFEITGGYGTVSSGNISTANAGTINASTFSQILNMNGMLDIDLDLTVSSDTLSSQRTEFVTPNGVWVVRVTDVSSSRPFVLQVTPKMSYAFSAQAKTGGMVITATKSGAATAGLAIAGDNINVINTTANFRVTSNIANQTVTFFIAPTSSYDPAVTNPANDAWARASAAKANGYVNELQATLNWWANYNSKSTINLPSSSDDLEKWYIRSMYYHGVFFGKSIIPPGLWGWSSVPAGGAVCPEFDLPFSQLAMLYSNHIDESANIVDWVEATLPQARLNAISASFYTCSSSHDDGAKYGWWVGYDGQFADPGSANCANIYSTYPSANCAAMTVKHADFTRDPAYFALAGTILLETTKVMVDDQVWNAPWGYLDVHVPNNMQQAACVYGLSQSVARGVQENSSWNTMLPLVYLPKGTYQGQQALVGGPGAIPGQGGYYGDAPLLHALWWYGVVDKSDPVVRPTFDMVSLSSTRNYTFNRGTMSVTASKLHDPNKALQWAKDLINSDVLHDDMSISEMVYDVHDFKRCPETAAHGAVMTSTIEMLIDPDNNLIEVFPAMPASWWAGVSFTNIAVKGAILVDAEIDGNNITINLANTNSVSTTRDLRVWLPSGTIFLSQSPAGTVVANGYAALSVTVPGNSNQDYLFVLPSNYCAEFLPGDINKDCYVDMRDFALLAENWLSHVP